MYQRDGPPLRYTDIDKRFTVFKDSVHASHSDFDLIYVVHKLVVILLKKR